MDKKTYTLVAAALVAGMGAGAGGQKLAGPSIELSAQAVDVRLSRDGFGINVEVKAGAAAGMRTLNWDTHGEHPLLDGQAFDDDNARELGKAVAAFSATVGKHVESMSETLATQKPTRVDPHAEVK